MGIEDHLALDVQATDFLVDLSNVVKNAELAGGKARLGRFEDVVAGLLRFARDPSALVYVVADNSLLDCLDLSRAERERLQRWARGGLIEMRPVADDRILEIADGTEHLIVTNDNYKEHHRRYSWLSGNRTRFLYPIQGENGVTMRLRTVPTPPEWELSLKEESREIGDAGLRGRDAEERKARLLGRLWECPEPGCPLFGTPTRKIQPVPRFTRTKAICPTHGAAMTDRGRAPRRAQVKVLVNQEPVTRFTLIEGETLVVGREPLEGLALRRWLDEYAHKSISRGHVRLTCKADRFLVEDVSANGTSVRAGQKLTELAPGRQWNLRRGEEVVLHDMVTLVLSGKKFVHDPDTEPQVSTPEQWAESTMIGGRPRQSNGQGRRRKGKGRR